MTLAALLGALALTACAPDPQTQQPAPPAATAPAAITGYAYTVVRTYPHDRGAFTEGLFYRDGFLYESTGLEGRSWIAKKELDTGKTVMQRDLDRKYFGEGIVDWKDRLIQLTWKNETGFIYDLKDFKPKGEFKYPGEGWALTHDGKRLIMTDGTPFIRFLDPETLKETGRIQVTANGKPLENLNEVEFVKGEIYANVWQTNFIVRIDPATGVVKGVADLTGILTPADIAGKEIDVLNGIAYDAAGDRLLVTGKFWPKIFEIKLTPR